MTDFNLRYESYLSTFENYLSEYAAKLSTNPEVLGESMKYSLQNGGKRIRPVLLLACAEILSVPFDDALPFEKSSDHTYHISNVALLHFLNTHHSISTKSIFFLYRLVGLMVAFLAPLVFKLGSLASFINEEF